VKRQKQEFFIYIFHSMYNKTIVRFGFCDIQNNQGLGKGYGEVWLVLALDYSGYHKNLIQYHL